MKRSLAGSLAASGEGRQFETCFDPYIIFSHLGGLDFPHVPPRFDPAFSGSRLVRVSFSSWEDFFLSHQSSSKLGDTPLARLDLFESLPSRRVGCRASTTNSTAKSRSTSLYNARSSSRAGCRALQLYSRLQSALQLYSSTALYTLHPLHPPSSLRSPSIRRPLGALHRLSAPARRARPWV